MDKYILTQFFKIKITCLLYHVLKSINQIMKHPVCIESSCLYIYNIVRRQLKTYLKCKLHNEIDYSEILFQRKFLFIPFLHSTLGKKSFKDKILSKNKSGLNFKFLYFAKSKVSMFKNIFINVNKDI